MEDNYKSSKNGSLENLTCTSCDNLGESQRKIKEVPASTNQKEQHKKWGHKAPILIRKLLSVNKKIINTKQNPRFSLTKNQCQSTTLPSGKIEKR
jgi:hypothetical protein